MAAGIGRSWQALSDHDWLAITSAYCNSEKHATWIIHALVPKPAIPQPIHSRLLNKYQRADMLTPMNPFTDEHSSSLNPAGAARRRAETQFDSSVFETQSIRYESNPRT
jgi:hypothetical protein